MSDAKEWTLKELRSDMAWTVIRAITSGEPLERAMQTCFDLVNSWQKQNKVGAYAEKTP